MKKPLEPGKKHPGGRPSKYTVELGNEICDRIAKGGTLRQIDRDPAMPSVRTILTWLLDKEKKEFLLQYARARDAQAELMFDELLEIADNTTDDWIEKDNGQVMFNKEAAMRSRLRVDTRKWYLSKVLPKKFGEKLDLTTDGKALPTPIYGGTSVQKHDSNEEGV